MVRSKNPVPTPREFKYNLRAITIAQYLKDNKNSNYDFAGGTDLADFLDGNILKALNKERKNDCTASRPDFYPPSIPNEDTKELSKMTKDILFYMAGNVMKAVKKRHITCESCLRSITSTEASTNSRNDNATLQNIKDITGHSLVQ